MSTNSKIASSFENVLSTSDSSNVVLADNKKMIQEKYDGKSKTGREKTSCLILDQKNVSLSCNELHERQDGDKIERKTIGNNIFLVVKDASEFLDYVKKNEMDKTKFTLSKGQDVILLTSKFTLSESVSVRYYYGKKFKEHAFEIIIEGRKMSVNPLLYKDGLRLTYKK